MDGQIPRVGSRVQEEVETGVVTAIPVKVGGGAQTIGLESQVGKEGLVEEAQRCRAGVARRRPAAIWVSSVRVEHGVWTTDEGSIVRQQERLLLACRRLLGACSFLLLQGSEADGQVTVVWVLHYPMAGGTAVRRMVQRRGRELGPRGMGCTAKRTKVMMTWERGVCSPRVGARGPS